MFYGREQVTAELADTLAGRLAGLGMLATLATSGRAVLDGRTGEVNSVAFSPDGTILATGDGPTAVTVIVRSGHQRQPERHPAVTSVDRSGDCRLECRLDTMEPRYLVRADRLEGQTRGE
ncbi:hypothetical protein SAMN05216275_108279 [Streptosporangium canum]|uniref:WD domain-containing protein, G-beta repeat-containing protein n=1 Tax=Streptosporangium canum TaxID=324952 RepID=A0A1I3R3U2_9ACTN|nr:hypothetical protein SAMN05216275_108279 [Streptosporangium canum]